MTRGSPVLDRERDLKGATPEKLARALLRPAARRKPVVGDQVAMQEGDAEDQKKSVRDD